MPRRFGCEFYYECLAKMRNIQPNGIFKIRSLFSQQLKLNTIGNTKNVYQL